MSSRMLIGKESLNRLNLWFEKCFKRMWDRDTQPNNASMTPGLISWKNKKRPPWAKPKSVLYRPLRTSRISELRRNCRKPFGSFCQVISLIMKRNRGFWRHLRELIRITMVFWQGMKLCRDTKKLQGKFQTRMSWKSSCPKSMSMAMELLIIKNLWQLHWIEIPYCQLKSWKRPSSSLIKMEMDN